MSAKKECSHCRLFRAIVLFHQEINRKSRERATKTCKFQKNKKPLFIQVRYGEFTLHLMEKP